MIIPPTRINLIYFYSFHFRCILIRGKTPSVPVLDPRTRKLKFLNRFSVLARGASLAIDPLFLFAITASPGPKPCIYIDGTMLLFATLLRTFVDLLHGMHLWLKFRMAYVAKESLVSGSGVLVWDSRAVVKQYVGSPKGFWFDLFVILPVPQVSTTCINSLFCILQINTSELLSF